MFSAVGAVRYLASGRGVFDPICDLIIRPPRAQYDPAMDLGPDIFRIGDDDATRYTRADLTLYNMRGMAVQCSWFRPLTGSRRPCVVYLHGNCGSRYDALEALFLLRHGFTLFALDASGSGVSDGEFISLGFYERQDLAAVVEYLAGQPDVDGIGLWGRSMGAVTAIMYAAKDTSIKCIVCDSPFSTLRLLIKDLVRRHGSKRIPSVIVDNIVDRIRKRIAKRAAFDIDDLDALKYASECAAPAFIFHGADDDFVLPMHSVAVHDAFKGSCLHHIVEGGHNDERDESVQNTIANFFTLYLILKPEGERDREKDPKPVIVKGRIEKTIQIPTSRTTPPGTSLKASEATSSSIEGAEWDETSANSKTYAPLVPISFTKPRLRDATRSSSPPSSPSLPAKENQGDVDNEKEKSST
ncbi:Xaa-Pro dipeptidyl-peptidase-like domain [Trypanosoma melophagium]|uniref:Xaa-Pro dipeptidyl-peptidase-like domain n=1 Tax=Trypanosoma melophagium TaxID=715481 RepID=UPI00351A9E71|nr:Xaa-Pro dipeptidyl-peptidase-like domain [Trypanosoma melophagium]